MRKKLINNRLRFEPIAHEYQVSHPIIVAKAEDLGGAVTARHLKNELRKKGKFACIARINRALDNAGWAREHNQDGVIVWVNP